MARGIRDAMQSLRQGGFRDRAEAGRLLGDDLARIAPRLRGAGDGIVVVGLARGGVVVAAEVARALGAPLDALAVRKISHPWQPEYGIGAAAPGCAPFVRSHDGLDDDEVANAVALARSRAEELDRVLHERHPTVPVAGATCVLVDDGLATGSTMVAAVRWARARGARTVIVAVPVGAAPTVRTLEQEADEVVCLAAPPFFGAVGSWYDDFHQVPDEDVLALLGASQRHDVERMEVDIPIEGARHTAELSVPGSALGWVLFAHGSGSSRRSPRNVQVASALNDAGIATVLFDLLTPAEEHDRRNVFDVDLLARRVIDGTGWLQGRPETQGLPVGYFGASTGAAAALVAAAELGDAVAAVVSRGGRPDLAGARLAEVRAPTLLVVGGADEVVLDLNRAAAGQLACPHELVVVPRATHLFPEPGALETVCSLASAWFVEHLGARAAVPTPSGAR